MLRALLLLSLVVVVTSQGFEDRNGDDEDVWTAANEAARKISKDFRSKYHHKLKKVIKAKSQVFPTGTNYDLTIIVGETVCKKDEVEYDETASCDFRETTVSTYKKCTTRVFRNQEGVHRVVSSGCILASKEDL